MQRPSPCAMGILLGVNIAMIFPLDVLDLIQCIDSSLSVPYNVMVIRFLLFNERGHDMSSRSIWS